MIKLKVCGMKLSENITQLAEIQPNYMGFIFYANSSRNFESNIPTLSSHIKKVGVFVNATLSEILANIKKHQLNAVQLHGDESAVFCEGLRQGEHSAINQEVEIIKAFALHDYFDFDQLRAYDTACDYFLFDTKGELPGGNGITFNWEILEEYTLKKPFFLSGGIGLNEINQLDKFLKSPASKYCQVIDVNSRFETAPGIKDIEKVSSFKKKLLKINQEQE